MRKIAGVLLFALMSSGYAGYNGLTHAAITKCKGADLNESASWDATKAHWLKVAGQHDGPQGQHTHFAYNKDWTNKKDNGFEYTYRSTATCRNDNARFGWYNWEIMTHHHVMTETGKGIIAHTGHYNDCKAYDGWWNI